MQDIKETKRERMSNCKHKSMLRGSSTLALHPRLRHTKDFHYARSQWISPRCRNTYKPSDSLVPYTRKPHKLAEAAPRSKEFTTELQTTTSTLARLLKEQRWNLWWSTTLWSPITNSHNTILWIDKAMDSSSDCKKARKELWWKTQEILFYTLDKTFL